MWRSITHNRSRGVITLLTLELGVNRRFDSVRFGSVRDPLGMDPQWMCLSNCDAWERFASASRTGRVHWSCGYSVRRTLPNASLMQ